MKVYERMVQVYRQCGYELVELARVNVKQRAEFLLARVSRVRDERA